MNKVKSLSDVVNSDPEIMSGVLVFKGTRVPVQALFDHIRYSSVERFLDGFPQVTREMVDVVLEWAENKLMKLQQHQTQYENAA